MDYGSRYRPIPNQIIGFPIEDFELTKNADERWDDLGVMVKLHFAAYPGSEWFTVYRKQIEEQYAGQGKSGST